MNKALGRAPGSYSIYERCTADFHPHHHLLLQSENTSLHGMSSVLKHWRVCIVAHPLPPHTWNVRVRPPFKKQSAFMLGKKNNNGRYGLRSSYHKLQLNRDYGRAHFGDANLSLSAKQCPRPGSTKRRQPLLLLGDSPPPSATGFIADSPSLEGPPQLPISQLPNWAAKIHHLCRARVAKIW